MALTVHRRLGSSLSFSVITLPTRTPLSPPTQHVSREAPDTRATCTISAMPRGSQHVWAAASEYRHIHYAHPTGIVSVRGPR